MTIWFYLQQQYRHRYIPTLPFIKSRRACLRCIHLLLLLLLLLSYHGASFKKWEGGGGSSSVFVYSLLLYTAIVVFYIDVGCSVVVGLNVSHRRVVVRRQKARSNPSGEEDQSK